MGRNFISLLGFAVVILLLAALAGLCLFDPYSTAKGTVAIVVLSLLFLGFIIVLLLLFFSRSTNKFDK
jgi:amino acid transporter